MAKLRLGAFVAIATLALAAAAVAGTLPAGWSAREDGAVVHGPSGAVCPTEIAGFKRVGLDSKGAPDLGLCAYTGAQDREGLIRVRQYVPGVGESSLAIQNDKMLMEPQPGRQIVAGQRVGPGPAKNGAPTQQFVLTIARKGLLVDCISRQLKSDEGKGAMDFALACMELQPE
jgi:hypothetical protein